MDRGGPGGVPGRAVHLALRLDQPSRTYEEQQEQQKDRRQQHGLHGHRAPVGVHPILRRGQDFLHRTSTNLVRKADTIVIEDLAVKNMVKNRSLARAISDAGWGEFRRQLEYKCERAGRRLVVIDRWYPSSKTCSSCGYLLSQLSLSTQHWTCPGCRTRHDRDMNAAKNILAAGRAVARQNSGDVCGAGVSRQGSSLPQSAMKQKPRAVRRVA
ncbi:transposase [Nonomuraea africana]|uniref:RNA-guided endonuclease InsQ/TnpB family protein n=1 Tax=Nonomuraea africana TaxID=46171 RepID=UPI0021F39B5C